MEDFSQILKNLEIHKAQRQAKAEELERVKDRLEAYDRTYDAVRDAGGSYDEADKSAHQVWNFMRIFG